MMLDIKIIMTGLFFFYMFVPQEQKVKPKKIFSGTLTNLITKLKITTDIVDFCYLKNLKFNFQVP